MMITAQEWARAISYTEYSEVMRDEALKDTWHWQDLYGSPEATDDDKDHGFVFSGLSMPHTAAGLDNIQSEDMKELGEWAYTDDELCKGVAMSIRALEKMRQKHLKGPKAFLSMAHKAIGEIYGQAKCVYAALPLLRGFSSSLQEMYDGRACFDTHTLEDGTTYTTLLPAISHGFDGAWDQIEFMTVTQKTYKGLRRRSTPALFIFYPTHERTYKKVWDQEWEPDSSDRNKNFLRRRVKLVPCVELATMSDARFMIGKEALPYWVFKIRKKLTKELDYHKKNRSFELLVHMQILVALRRFEHMCAIQSTS